MFRNQFTKKIKPKYNLGQNVTYMIHMAWKYKKEVIFFCFLYTGVTLGVNITQLFFAPVILNKVEAQDSIKEVFLSISLFSILLFVLYGVTGYLRRNLMYGRIIVRSLITKDVNEKSGRTSYPNTVDVNFLNLRSKAQNVCNDNSKATEHIWYTLTDLMINIGGFFIYILLLSEFNFFLLLTVILTTLLGTVLSNWINGWEYRHRSEIAQIDKKIDYFTSQMHSIAFAKEIRIFGLTEWIQEIYKKTEKAGEAFILKREKIYALNCFIDAALLFIRNGIAYFYLIELTLKQQLSVAEFLLYFNTFTGFSVWITGILSQVTVLYKESLDISTVQEYLHYPEVFMFQNGKPIPKTKYYELRLENVSFHYPHSKKKIFHGLNLVIHPGEKIAVVGLNGAGKTTLIKLICGFYDPDEGRVLLNGIDIREFNRQEYYDILSAVFQDMSVLDITIAENIAQSLDEIDYDKVNMCLEKAGLCNKIAALPKGIHTHVGRNVYLDGIEFSGGEIQRLMLARALYRDGSILILDEPTAALDPIAENDIYLKYNEMTAEKTSIFVSHRLASTRFCDRILFLEDGNIAEEGTHEELLSMGGKYAKLFEVQAKYYKEENIPKEVKHDEKAGS